MTAADVKAMSPKEWRRFIRDWLPDLDGDLIRAALAKDGSPASDLHRGKYRGPCVLIIPMKSSSSFEAFALAVNPEGSLEHVTGGTKLKTIVATSNISGQMSFPDNLAAKLCERHGVVTTGSLHSERMFEWFFSGGPPFLDAETFDKMGFDILDAFAMEAADNAESEAGEIDDDEGVLRPEPGKARDTL